MKNGKWLLVYAYKLSCIIVMKENRWKKQKAEVEKKENSKKVKRNCSNIKLGDLKRSCWKSKPTSRRESFARQGLELY